MDALVCWCLPRSLPRCVLVCGNALGRLLFIGVWGWVSDTWRSLIGDTCHSLIGSLMSSLTRAGLLVSSLTRAGPLESSLTRAKLLESSLTHTLKRDWFLHSVIGSCMTLGKFILASE